MTVGASTTYATRKVGRPSLYTELLAAVSLMDVGDPPLRWNWEQGRMKALITRLGQVVPGGFWCRFHKDQVWIVRFE